MNMGDDFLRRLDAVEARLAGLADKEPEPGALTDRKSVV
jgi:hypothetical protein